MRQPKLSIFLAYGIFIADKYENNKKKKTQQIKMKQTNEWDNQVIDGNAWEKKSSIDVVEDYRFMAIHTHC